MKLEKKVSQVLLGVKMSREAENWPAPFLAILLREGPTNQEILEICRQLTELCHQDGLYLLREFVGQEIHLFPSGRSAHRFIALRDAVQEYAVVLEAIGLEMWAEKIEIDGDILPFDERSRKPVGVLAEENRELFRRTAEQMNT